MYAPTYEIPTGLPFFHPTSTVVVDDDPDFLQSFNFMMGDTFACRLFHKPAEAIASLQKGSSFVPSSTAFFSPCTSGEGFEAFDRTDRFIAFLPSKVRDVMFQANRFHLPSVVVVDYDMPEMNGVEFCRQIKALPVKKVMLTGKADEKVAVQAFNEGLIDRFIFKQSDTAPKDIFLTIHQLQHAYFKDMTAPLIDALMVRPMEFIDDPKFGAYFSQLCKNRGCIEYYFSTEPSGILMIDPAGSMNFLLVRDAEALRTQRELAEDADAPQELLERLQSGTEQPWFPTQNGYYDPNLPDWQKYLYPVERVDGTSTWSCSFITDVEPFFDPNMRYQSNQD